MIKEKTITVHLNDKLVNNVLQHWFITNILTNDDNINNDEIQLLYNYLKENIDSNKYNAHTTEALNEDETRIIFKFMDKHENVKN